MRNIIISLFLLLSFSAPAVFGDELKLAPDAPDRYVVKKGDTLWAISGRYLTDPWRWPELWGWNKEQIRNPHLIYPGDVLVLDRSGAVPRLEVAASTVKLSPKVRAEPLADAPIPTIPRDIIDPFLAQPLVIEATGLDRAPRIVATSETRVIVSTGDRIGVVGLPQDQGLDWDVYQPGKPFIDPDTKEILGYEAVHLGSARALRFGDVSSMEIVRVRQEIVRGDRLVKAAAQSLQPYVPHAPEKKLTGRVISTYRGSFEVGPKDIVVINRGTRDGIETGHVLAIRPDEGRINGSRKRSTNTVPFQRIGLLMVFRPFDRVSYAMVMEASGPVALMNVVETP